jgi:hypothetical protein
MSPRDFVRVFAFAACVSIALAACEPMVNEETLDPVQKDLVGSSGSGDDHGGGGDDDGGVDPGSSCPGGYRFAISESDSSANVRAGELRDGIFPLYLWKLSGTGISALQGELVIQGGSYFPGSFSAEDPFFGVTLPDGPDVLIAVGGCPCEELLVGQFYVEIGADGASVNLVPGPGGGAVNCAANPQPVGFQCLPYSSR